MDNVPQDSDFLIPAIMAVSAFAPGFIIVFIRNQLLTGRTKSILQLAAEYGLVSAVYYSCTLSVAEVGFSSWQALFVSLFITPVLVGLVIGVVSQKGYVRRFLGFIGIETVHPAPTAWDYIFGFSGETHWVIVTLKDGSTICGLFRRDKSFASSDLSIRDLYIAEVTDENFNLPESARDKRGIWINESEIRTIEFIGS